jgi:hypothetical protein
MLAPIREPVFVVEPATHSEQLLANAEPGVSTYVPATQPMHDVARCDAVEYCPTAQAVQVVAPSFMPLSVTEPAAQTVHDGTIDAFEYSPATHAMHELAPAAVPVSVREPAKQPSQYDAAIEAWYLPNWQSTQLVWLATAWYCPSLHSKHAFMVDMLACLPFSQAVHLDAPSFIPALVIDPAAHSVHLLTLEFVENRPASQGIQLVASGWTPVLVLEPGKQVWQKDWPSLVWC